ncbi:MAG: L-ribulose-5-phosphate 3-epimerase [Clostridiales Family XIII bacterium]|jgi:predicted hexulose-6-phosphate isomerase|nr:L-ribulose-5-phosphate 3-epimerase [Clostridiales Family XIII bacterium]
MDNNLHSSGAQADRPAAAYRLGLYEKSMPGGLPFERMFREAKSAGYDFLEISIDETDGRLARLDWGDAEFHALLEARERAGLGVETMCLSGHRRFPLGDPDPQGRARGIEILGKAIRFASRAGIRIVQLAGYDVYYKEHTEETERLFAEGLALGCRMAAAYGVALGFETMETPFMDTVAKARAWVDRVGSPYLMIYPDSGNLWNAAALGGADPLADLEAGRGRILALHLKETKPGRYREVPYGQGHVDFARLIPKALDLGVRLFNAEFWHDPQTDWQEALRANAAFLRGHFPKK